MRGISQAFLEYKQLKLLKNPIKGIYILLFLLMTLIVVFSFTWFGLHLARGITGPIEQLAEGTREVAAGNLAYKVQTRGDDEIGMLVESFNRMTDDLGAVQAPAGGGLHRSSRQAHRARGPPTLHRDRAGGDHHRRGLARPARPGDDHQPRRRPHVRHRRGDQRGAPAGGAVRRRPRGATSSTSCSGRGGPGRPARPWSCTCVGAAGGCRCWPPPPRCAARAASTPARWWCSTI